MTESAKPEDQKPKRRQRRPRNQKSDLNVYQRINKVMESVAYIRKTAEVRQGGSYMAVTHDEVTKQVRKHMVIHGLLIVPSLKNSEMVDTTTVTTNNNPIMQYRGIYEIKFINIDNKDDFFSVDAEGHANETADKAPGKALSYAVKNTMLKVFGLETGENEEQTVEGRGALITEVDYEAMAAACKARGFPVEETLKNLAMIVYKIKDGDITMLPHNHVQDAIKRILNREAKAVPDDVKPEEKQEPAAEETPEKPKRRTRKRKEKPAEEPAPESSGEGEPAGEKEEPESDEEKPDALINQDGYKRLADACDQRKFAVKETLHNLAKSMGITDGDIMKLGADMVGAAEAKILSVQSK